MNRLFFLKQKNRGYIQKRPTIYRPIRKRKYVYKMYGETRTFHLWFGEGLSYNIQSAEDGLVQVSVHKLQVIFACAESSRSSQTEWAVLWLSSFSIFQTRLHELQLWWATYNSSSLGANISGDPGLPYEEQTGHLQKVSQWTSLSFFLVTLYSISFQDYYPYRPVPSQV